MLKVVLNLNIFEKKRFNNVINDAVKAAYKRSKELSKK